MFTTGGGEGRVLQSRWVDQGPGRDPDGRGRRTRRPLTRRRHDHRADLGQHRHRARDRRAPEGLPGDRGDAGQDVAREDRPPARVRRRGRRVPDRRRSGLAAVLLPGRGPADAGDPGRVPAQPVLEPGEPGGALPEHRAGAVAPVRRADHALRVRRRDRRDDHRRRALSEGAQPEHRGDRGRSRRLDLLQRERASVPGRGRRRGLLARDVRPVGRGPLRHGLRPRRVPDHAPARRDRGPAGRRLVRARGPCGAGGRERD